ncbi:MAG TPA: nitrate- and nitrite sensing domain-containing protein, partial [Pseudonocardiaceae bacterium]|nr:nitrate- and nitrite sensing domain-containing protein [Pseudonocardiaceae bacterium]
MAGNEQQGSSPASSGVLVDPDPQDVAVPEEPDASSAPIAPATGRWRLSNWRLRSKLFVVLLVPLATAAVLGSLQVVTQVSNARTYDRLQNDSNVAASLSSVIDNLQVEREQIALYAASGKKAGAGLGSPQTEATDEAINSFKALGANDGSDSPETQAAVVDANIALTDLNNLRSVVSATSYPDVFVLAGYNQLIAALLHDTQVTESGVADQAADTLVNGLNNLRQAKEEFSQTTAILMITAQDGTFPGLQEDALRSAQAQYTAAVTAFKASASPADQAMYANTVAGPDVDNSSAFLTLIENRIDNHEPAGTSPQDVQLSGGATAKLIGTAETNIYKELSSVTGDLASGAIGQAFRVGLLVLLGLVIAFLVALFVARSLVRTLQRLRSGALDVARNRLPASVRRILADPDPIKASEEAVEPVPVFTADEVGEVARSFDVVHGQAVRLAAEQAVLRDNVNAIFVNLARRSQVLVERQLSLIDRLERDEQDPDQLANLFELDHLATRMRRNSESLLVLSGSGLAKRMSQSVPIGDLVGAAVSEVEQYARIEVGAPPNVQIFGRVVNDLIHLIAELLDNATVFSEPNTKVSVRIAKTRSREVAIQITDR